MSWTCARCGATYDALAPRCPSDGGALVPTEELRLGQTLAGRYRLTGLLGGGTHALVYRARHEAVGLDVAVKVMRAAHAAKPLLRERFSREARAANRIRHPNVLDVTDVGETVDGAPFLVMHLLEGRALLEALGEPWPEARVRWLGAEVASALAAAHAQGVVHRDLGPANILLLSETRVQVVDFGVAKLDGERRLTASAVTLGTPGYMAPEQVRGDPVTDRSDTYALACVLYEALTGRPPFEGSGPAVMAAHLREPVPPLPDHVSAELAALVLGALAKDPVARPSARDFAAACSGEPLGEAAHPTPPSRADRLRERRALLERLLVHLHPEGDMPESIALGLADARRAVEALRTPGPDAGLVQEHLDEQREIEERVERALPSAGARDASGMRALAALGRLADRWLVIDGLRDLDRDEPPPSVEGAEAVLDAIEAYIESHPDGASLLPPRA